MQYVPCDTHGLILDTDYCLQVLTAMAVEAMTGARGSFDPFVSEARPHVGQIEAAHLIHELLAGSRLAVDHEKEVKIEEDDGVLRQDRSVLVLVLTCLSCPNEFFFFQILASYGSAVAGTSVRAGEECQGNNPCRDQLDHG